MESQTHTATQVNDLEWECKLCGYKVVFDLETKKLNLVNVGDTRFSHQFERDWLDPYRQHFQAFD